jgi:catechol 2,3-dioxygenase-like lactoylglutathione lyase family enzyme
MRKLPPITQIAYLVEDLDEAIQFWTRHLSVGPFKLLPHIQFTESEYNSRLLEIDLSIALAWRNGIQVELMQQHSAAASVFTDFGVSQGGYHHVGIKSDDILADSDTLVSAGMHCVQRNVSSTGTETRFFVGGPGTGVIELIRSPDGGSLSDNLRQAAERWDGSNSLLP